MKIFYNILTGRIRNIVPKNQSLESFYVHYGEDFVKNMREIEVNLIPDNWHEYVVVEGELVRMSDSEISDINIYGRILTKEERILESMKPSMQEVEEAEMTIKILSILEGVI